MNRVLQILTSQRTTWASVVFGLCLLFFDAKFIAALQGLGVTVDATTKLVAGAKVLTYVLAALGFSPLKKPLPQEPTA